MGHWFIFWKSPLLPDPCWLVVIALRASIYWMLTTLLNALQTMILWSKFCCFPVLQMGMEAWGTLNGLLGFMYSFCHWSNKGVLWGFEPTFSRLWFESRLTSWLVLLLWDNCIYLWISFLAYKIRVMLSLTQCWVVYWVPKQNVFRTVLDM